MEFPKNTTKINGNFYLILFNLFFEFITILQSPIMKRIYVHDIWMIKTVHLSALVPITLFVNISLCHYIFYYTMFEQLLIRIYTTLFSITFPSIYSLSYCHNVLLCFFKIICTGLLWYLWLIFQNRKRMLQNICYTKGVKSLTG